MEHSTTMKNFRGILNDLEKDLFEQYLEFKKQGNHYFLKKCVESDIWDDLEKEELHQLLDKTDFVGLDKYMVFEHLPVVWCNNQSGEEIEGIVLTIVRERGVLILNRKDYDIFYISFEDINTTSSKIDLLEEIESLILNK
jgi:hypothetical protein